MTTKRPFHEVVAQNLIEKLEQGTAPWQKPWQPSAEPLLPHNPSNGRRYKGINTINLMAQGFNDPRWMTYNQANAAKAQVIKGQKGTQVQYWKFSEEKNKTDDKGNVVKDSKGKPIKIHIVLERPKVFYATVFNAQQIEGLPPLEITPLTEERQWQNIERAEKLLQASNAIIKHDQADRAYYSSAKDSIHLPKKEQFDEAGKYYATALHELGHWSGHSSRLNRDLGNPFGSEAYAKEELRAEIASMMLGDELGIGHDPSQHTSYVKSWIKALKNDPIEIFRAASDAEKILTMLLGFELQQEQQMPIEQTLNDEQIQSWQTINSTANELGFKAVLSATPNEPCSISFNNRQGITAPVNTMLHDDGSVRTQSETETSAEVTTTPERIQDALLIALAPYQHIEQVDVIEAPQTSPQRMAPATSIQEPDKPKIHLDVPYKDKDQVKALGATWDKATNHWSVPQGTDLTPFSQWPVVIPSTTKQYLAVPYEQRNQAKAAGAKWDKSQSAWFINLEQGQSTPPSCTRWLPQNQRNIEQEPQLDPREEFAERLKDAGFDVSGEHPIMDGKRHRCRVDSDKPSTSHNAGAGMYVAFMDAHPGGYAINNRTGEELKWKAKGYNLSPEDRAIAQAQAAQRQQEQQAIKEQTQTKVASAISRLVAVSPQATGQESYITKKQITTANLLRVPSPDALANDPDILIGKTWQDSKALREANPDKLVFTTGELLVPAIDEQGNIRTAQTIQSNGTKMFPRGGQKTGTFHIVGGELEDIARISTIIIAEGLATADTIAEASKHPVISAFDAGNVIEVAKELHNKYPDKTLLICGDDDAHLALTEIKGNVGHSKAHDAAELTGGKVLLPVFAPGEQDYPSHLPPMTPDKWRNQHVSQEEKKAIDDMKQFTDFNDLKTKSKLGIEGVKRQLCAMLHQIHEQQHVTKEQQQVQQQILQQPQQKPAGHGLGR